MHPATFLGLGLKATARLAGGVYLVNIALGIAAAAASGTEGGDLANLAAALTYVVVTLLFYVLFRPAGAALALVASVVSLGGCALGAAGALHLFAAPINPLALFGVYCLAVGLLAWRSDYVPRAFGVLMAIGGIGWLTFAVPTLARALLPWNLAPGVIGESALTLRLLFAGVDATRWQARAAAA